MGEDAELGRLAAARTPPQRGQAEATGRTAKLCGAGAAGAGCERGAVLFMQQQVLPQQQHEQPDRTAAAGATCAQTAGTLCAQTSATLNRMANSGFTRVVEAVAGPGSV